MNTLKKIPVFGDANKDVEILQQSLLEFGFNPGPIDGIFGGKTRDAISKFQKSIGLAGSGIIGPKTLAGLDLFIDEELKEEPIFKLPHHVINSPRNLVPALEALIDDEILKSFRAEYLEAIVKKDTGALMVICCKALDNMSIREKTNKNDGYHVELIQKVSGGKRGYAWCMYAVQVSVAWVERKTGIVSALYSSGSCASVRAKTPSALSVKPEDSKPGDVWVWIYNSGLGHTGVFSEWKSKLVKAYLYEGNTTKGLGKDGQINREGGGYYKTERAFVISGMKLGKVFRPFI